nr:hypothetical protein [Clostridia bacterium]
DKGQMDSFKQAIDQYINALIIIAGKYEEAETRNLALNRFKNQVLIFDRNRSFMEYKTTPMESKLTPME